MHSIKSMTGFASVRANLSTGSLAMDMRSVNSRYLELILKLPDNFRYLENDLRDKLKAAAVRGKFELILTYAPASSDSLHLNQELVVKICNSLKEIKKHFPEGSADLTSVLLYPGVVSEEEINRETLDGEIMAQFDELVAALIANREREGARLAAILSEKVDAVEKCLEPVKEQLDTLVAQEYAKLSERIKTLQAADIDENRLQQEVALMAQKADIAEEYDRLCSHIAEVRRILKIGGACGKRLDFMMQEFNREANTMASKASNLSLTKIAVELKVLIEQMREQVQNIE